MLLARTRAGRKQLADVPYPVLMRIEARRRELCLPLEPIMTLGRVAGGWIGLAISGCVTLKSSIVVSVIAFAAAAGGVAALIIRVRTLRRRQSGAMIAAYLSERRCPACGYDLAGCEPDADTCTVCPECGAAWRFVPTPKPPG